MKDVTFEVEFTQHVLASGVNQQGRRDCFDHTSDGELIFQQRWWYTAFKTAIAMEHVKSIKPSDIYMDLTVDAPTEMYKRKYGRDKVRVHEAIMPGTRVTFRAVVSDIVTESTLRRLLERVGKYIGISPYGHHLGYGHFILHDLTVQKSDVAVTSVYKEV